MVSLSYFLLHPWQNGRLAFVVFAVLILTLLIDTTLYRISDVVRGPPYWTVPVFTSIVVTTVISSFLLMHFTRKGNITDRGSKPSASLSIVSKLVTLGQICIGALTISIVLQLLIFAYFNTLLVFTAIAVSYSLAVFTLIMLTVRFFIWFRRNRNFVVLFYSVSSLTLAANTIVTLSLIAILSPGLPSQIGQSQIASLTRPVAASLFGNLLNSSSLVLSGLSFVFLWIATALLLKSFAKKIGILRFWIIFSIPLVYFLSQFPTLFFNIVGIMMSSNPSFFGVIITVLILFSLTKPVGGILFALAFWRVSSKFDKDALVKAYLMAAGFGIVLLFISNQGGNVLIQSGAQYPPFGVASTSVMGLSSYLLFLGIYSSALSVAQDSRLRGTIKRSTEEQYTLLDKIGTAQMNKNIEQTVKTIVQSQAEVLADQTGIESSLEEEDIRDYINEVLEEIKKTRSPG